MPDIILHRPVLEELSFRQALLSDEATMAFNHAWGGTTKLLPAMAMMPTEI